jgi:hypothetical protein
MSKPFAFWVQLATVVSMSTVVSLKPFQTSSRESQRSMASPSGIAHRMGASSGFASRAQRDLEAHALSGDPAIPLEWNWSAFLQREHVSSWIAGDGTSHGMVEGEWIGIATGSWVVGLESGRMQSGNVAGGTADAEAWDLFRNPGQPGSPGPDFDDPMAQGRAATVDELFDGPAISSPVTTPMAETARTASKAVSSDPIDLKGRFIATLGEGGDESEISPIFSGAAMRSWSDNTGSYHVVARVPMIFEDRVRLVKENGRTTTVPMRRLSEADQQYVKWVAGSMAMQSSPQLVR